MSAVGGLLVFGKTGQVARELARQNPKAHILGRDAADLTDPDACATQIARLSPTAVINAAAYTAVDQAETDTDTAHIVNAAAPGAMARACADLGIPFVQISTDYVFDGSGDAPRTPDAPTGPLSIYGASKLAGEEAVRAADGVHVILRTAWVVSSHGTNFVKTMLRLGATRDRLSVVDDQVGGLTPAADIAAATQTIARKLMEQPGLGGTYHFSGTPEVSWADVARTIFAEVGLDCQVDPISSADYPTPARRPLNSRLECSATTAAFGIDRPDWRSGLRKILEELKGQMA